MKTATAKTNNPRHLLLTILNLTAAILTSTLLHILGLKMRLQRKLA